MASGGYRCPYCHSEQIEAESLRLGEDESTVTTDVRCPECQRRWRDVYALADVLELPDE